MSADPMVTVRRVLPAPPDIVYDEWLDPVGMLEWMCPRPARAVKISLEVGSHRHGWGTIAVQLGGVIREG